MSRTDSATKWKLSLMMALVWAVFGAWLPLLLQHMQNLGFTVLQQTIVGTAPAAAAMLAVFFGNDWADRRFAQEKFLAFSQLITGLSLIALFWVTSFWPFCILMYVQCFFYMPSISVTNSIAFRHLKDTAREFGHVRMWGPVGWMAVSWPMYFILKGKEGLAAHSAIACIFLVGGVSAIALAVYSMFLPHTPPIKSASSQSGAAWLNALQWSGKPFLVVLLCVALIDATNHMGYFILSGSFLESLGVKPEWIMPIMGLSQLSEIFVTFGLGFILTRLGWRITMIVGILAHATRFAAYAFMADHLPVIIGVQLLHGVCYACFFATLYIFVDKAYPKEIQASAQGVFNFIILGLGDLFAKWLFIPAKAWFTSTSGVVDYHNLFLIPTALAIAAALLLAIAFHPPKTLSTLGEES